MSRQATTHGAAVLDDLGDRGLVHDTTDPAELRALLAEPPAVLYLGIDPSAASLHLGNLIGVLVLRRFAEAGHRPLALVGGATGMVGDPSGRSDERNLLDAETLEANVAAIRRQYATIRRCGRGRCRQQPRLDGTGRRHRVPARRGQARHRQSDAGPRVGAQPPGE